MSFFDNFAANLNSNKTFFDQIDLSKNANQNFLNGRKSNSREAFGKAKLELGNERSYQLDKKSSGVFDNKEASFEVKKQDSKEDKKDFFKTAKDIFTDYKKKTDKKASKEELEEELKTADATLDLIFQTVTQPIVEKELGLESSAETKVDIDLKVGLDLIEHEPQIDPDPELLDFFLEKVTDQLNTEIEAITQDIVKLDLSTQEGVKAIIDLSSQVEKLQDLEANLQELEAKLSVKLDAKEFQSNELKPELKLLVETKIATKIEEIKNLDIQAQADTNEDTKGIKQILDEIKAGLKQAESLKSQEGQVNNKKTDADYNVKVLQDFELKAEGTRKTDFSKADVEILEIKEVPKAAKNNSKQEKGFSFSNNNFETLFPKEIKASNVKVQTLTKPVPIKQLPDLIQKETANMQTNSSKEIRMVLDPENLGKLQVNITREDNQIHISMIVRTDEAATKLEQKINDIRAALKDKGFEASIDVSKSDSNNSSESHQQQRNEGNEARDEQKEKYLNQIPEWISDDMNKLSFSEAFERII